MKIDIHLLTHLAQFFLEREIFQTKFVNKIKKHILRSFFPPENCAFCEIACKYIVQPDRPGMTIWCMHISRWVQKVANTHSEYVILTAFPLQK